METIKSALVFVFFLVITVGVAYGVYKELIVPSSKPSHVVAQATSPQDDSNAALVQLNSTDQSECLDAAYKDYKKAWNAADTDGDGKISYQDGWLSIQTNYYDGEIDCYQTYKTPESDSEIADLQQKRQQDTDTYNAWLGSLRQNNTYPTNCTSYTYGIDNKYTSTRCY